VDEHRHGIATRVGVLRIHNAMGRGFEQAVGEVLQHIA